MKKIDISEYIKTIPLLTTKNRNFINKESCNYVTSQWDSSGKNRQIDNNARKRIIDKYVKMGYEVVTIGGEAENDELKYSLKHIAHVISNAKLHIGVDSGFMHLAQLYLPATNLHIYHERKGWWSHHILRLIDNGGILNQYYIRISIFDRLLNRMRYDSKISRRFICFFMRGKNDNK